MAMEAVLMELNNFRDKYIRFFKRSTDSKDFINLNRIALEDTYLGKLKRYQGEILFYLAKISRADLDEKLQVRYMQLISVVNILESMIESIEIGIVQAKHQAFENKIQPSPTMINLLGDLAKEVEHGMDHALLSLIEKNPEKALVVLSVKSKIDHLIQTALEHQSRNFKADNQRMMVFRLEMQMVDAFKRLHTLSKRIARYQLEPNITTRT